MLKLKDAKILKFDITPKSYRCFGADEDELRYDIEMKFVKNDKVKIVHLKSELLSEYGSPVGVDDITTLVTDLIRDEELEQKTLAEFIIDHLVEKTYFGMIILIQGESYLLTKDKETAESFIKRSVSKALIKDEDDYDFYNELFMNEDPISFALGEPLNRDERHVIGRIDGEFMQLPLSKIFN